MGRSRRRPKGKRATQIRSESSTRSGSPIRRTQIFCLALLFIAAVLALVWDHRAGFFLSWTDEQIHLYVAHRMAEGAVLYRDIDSARPPLALFPLAWLLEAGFSPLLAGRALVLVAQLATGALLFWGGWRLVTLRAGAIAALLFLTSPETFARIHYTGIHFPALAASAALLFFMRAEPFFAGLCVGFSVASDQHGLIVCGIVALLTVFSRPRDIFPFATGALAVLAVVFGGTWALGGRHLWKDLIALHLFHLRPGSGMNATLWELLKPWLYEHTYLFVGATLSVVFAAAKGRESSVQAATASRLVRVLLVVVGAHVIIVLAMTDAAFLYLVVVAPLLTLMAGIGFDAAIRWWQSRRGLPPSGARRRSQVITAGAALIGALIIGGWSAARSDRERLDDRPYSFWPYVRHIQLAQLQRLDVARRVATDPVMPTAGTIFGEPMIATAVALATGLRVSGEMADLNWSWIEAGAITREDVVRRIERDNVSAVITPPWFLLQDAYFRSYLAACYMRPKIFSRPDDGPGSGLPDIAVFPHAGGGSPCRAFPP